jgi:hypothetical protein
MPIISSTSGKIITPLISLKTDLKSLKFGADLPGYGSSNQPFIQTQIPNDFVSNPLPTSGNTQPIFRPTSTGGFDYPRRGTLSSANSVLTNGFGFVEVEARGENYSVSNIIDHRRIKAFLETARGKTFLDKQKNLQLSNPKTETGNTLFGQFTTTSILPGLIENTRVYNNGRNTLQQIKEQGSGIHISRIGLSPFNYLEKFYIDVVGAQNALNEKQTNRLLILQKLKIKSSDQVFTEDRESIANLNLVNKLGISYDKSLIFQYLGGPGSSYGLGPTIIKRYDDTTSLVNPAVRLASTRTMTYDTILNKNTTPGLTKITDFRLSVQDETIRKQAWDYNTQSLESKFYVGIGNYKDKMNKLLPFVFNSDTDPWSSDLVSNGETKDIIKFVFECVDNDNPSTSVAIFFRAFLTAGLTDNNTAELNAFKYMGRGENFYTYQGFTRSINFSFRIAAGSSEELIPLYSKLNRLISQVYPDYSDKTSIMRAPLVKVTVGDYLFRMPGFLESVNVTIDNEATWETRDGRQLPQYIDVNVAFKPIFKNLPERSKINSQMAIITNPNLSSLDNTVLVNTRLPQESNELQNQTRDLINQAAATREIISNLEESGFFNNSVRNRRI